MTALPLDLTGASEALRARFWSHVDIGEPDACWPWTGHLNDKGYGSFAVRKNRPTTASRVALALTIGRALTATDYALHTCDNPPCCNPAHLFAGSNLDNALDCIAKGRARRQSGTAHRSARLTEAQVRTIRATDVSAYGARTRLAREHGVSLTAIKKVLSGKTWVSA